MSRQARVGALLSCPDHAAARSTRAVLPCKRYVVPSRQDTLPSERCLSKKSVALWILLWVRSPVQALSCLPRPRLCALVKERCLLIRNTAGRALSAGRGEQTELLIVVVRLVSLLSLANASFSQLGDVDDQCYQASRVGTKRPNSEISFEFCFGLFIDECFPFLQDAY